jgi:mRNA-degrading endonuclease RelE of RelBE toxin-antitoxin system
MTREMQKKFKKLTESQRQAIKDKFAYKGDDNGFIIYVKQQGLGMEVMWMIIDPTNPVDPRYLC